VKSDATSTSKKSWTLFALSVHNHKMQVLSIMTLFPFSVASLYLCKLQGRNLLSCWSAKWCIFYYLEELHTDCSVRAKSRNASFVDHDTLSSFRCVSLFVQATRLKIFCQVKVKSNASNSNKRSCTLFALCVQKYEVQVLSSTTDWRFSFASLYLCKLQG
jgi:hypothetical protein